MTKATDPKPEVKDLCARMFAAQLRLGVVLKEARMSPGAWSRWASGAEPKLSSLKAVSDAIERLSS